ncbi:MAG: zinc metallopeptidase [Clostridia bacterium]|jgi:Zn-dependent membrane protease YugP|nr:zinc metallopeptidase [Clostridia bacterium]
MFFPYFDPTLIIVLPGLLLAIYAQFKVKSAFYRYSRVPSERGLTGAQAASEILRSQGLDYVDIEMIDGELTDHYDPRDKVLRLSPQVYRGTSLASLGVAAHEAGHALQHATGYTPLNIRNGLVPIANLGSTLAFPLFFLGLFFSFTLVKLGLWLFAFAVLFQLVTLPVEFNASKRAVALLEGNGFITRTEVDGTQKVLKAAALTYVAALLVSLLQLLRLLIISGVLRNSDN